MAMLPEGRWRSQTTKTSHLPNLKFRWFVLQIWKSKPGNKIGIIRENNHLRYEIKKDNARSHIMTMNDCNHLQPLATFSDRKLPFWLSKSSAHVPFSILVAICYLLEGSKSSKCVPCCFSLIWSQTFSWLSNFKTLARPARRSTWARGPFTSRKNLLPHPARKTADGLQLSPDESVTIFGISWDIVDNSKISTIKIDLNLIKSLIKFYHQFIIRYHPLCWISSIQRPV